MEKLIIFDLDGTLLNSIADLANATNYALAKNGFPTHETEKYNFFVGNGINKLFERALPEGQKTPENVTKVKEVFVPYYDVHDSDESSLYVGIKELLEDLQSKGFKLAVASNKYHTATERLVKKFFPNIHFDKVYGQREGVNPKPDPTIVLDILKETGIDKENTVYVGDSGVDMQTASNAGVTSIGVTWGFRPRAELEEFAANYIVEEPSEILQFI